MLQRFKSSSTKQSCCELCNDLPNVGKVDDKRLIPMVTQTSRLFIALITTLSWVALDAAAAELVRWTQTRVLEAPEAFQAAAADAKHVYAISSTEVAKYDRESGKRIAVSTGEAKHLNSGFFWEGRLFCAHSNYPQQPEQSEIKVLDLETMRLETYRDFGNFGGSLTWAVRHVDHWWCNFAHYGKDNGQTFLVKFDGKWQEQGRWTYPPELIRELGDFSLSGGIWLDGSLLVTDHDHPVLYRFQLPTEGQVLKFVDKQPAPFTGQGFAIDPRGGLVGIQRAKRQIVFASRNETKQENDKIASWNGYEQRTFTVDGRNCLLVVPKAPAEEKPWIWRAEFFGHEPQADLALLDRGFHVAYIDVQNLYGAPKALDAMDRFYAHLVETRGLSKKTVLEGFSRGGLFALNWAARNPDRVACIYNDAPVCDFKSWPGGRGKGKGSPGDWKLCLEAYGLSLAEGLAYRRNPVDNLEPLAKAKVPLLHICGDADDVVPIEENTRLLERRYLALGGDITVIAKPGVGHHPHSLRDPKPIVEFIMKHALGKPAEKNSSPPKP